MAGGRLCLCLLVLAAVVSVATAVEEESSTMKGAMQASRRELQAWKFLVSDAHLKINPASGKKNDGHGIARGIVYFALAGPIFVLGAMMGV